MNISEAGKAFIKRREACLLVPTYDKIGQVWNVGYGHVYRDNEPHVSITQDEADALFDLDILYYVDRVNEVIKIDVPQPVFDCGVSLRYNIPGEAFRDSSFIAFLNAGQFADACVSLLLFRKAQGKDVNGLVNRRAYEMIMFAEGVYL